MDLYRFVVVVALLLTSLAAAPGRILATRLADIHVGQETEISVDSTLHVADATLRPGEYVVRHQSGAREHVILFTKADNANVVVRARCRLEQLGATANYTAIELSNDASGGRRLAELVIAGENVRHVF